MLAAVLPWLASNLTEVIGFVTGLAAVVLAARRIIWTFPVGIANNVFFFVLFVQSALYAAAGLQVVFGLLGAWGWVTWTRRPAADHRVAVGRMPGRAAITLVLVGLAATAVITAALAFGTDSTTSRPTQPLRPAASWPRSCSTVAGSSPGTPGSPSTSPTSGCTRSRACA